MIAYEISHNGKVIAVVGAKDLIGLNAVLMACGELNGASDAVRLFNVTALGVAKGSRKNTTLHHTWTVEPTKGRFDVGDTVTVRIVNAEKVSAPSSTQELENEDAEPPAVV